MFWNRIMMYLIIASMIFPPGMQIAIAQDTENLPSSPVPDGSVQYELYQTGIDRMTNFMRDMQSQLDRTAFDFDALLDSLNYDADEIIEYSKTAIAFEQYPGVLRGSLGTLFSRAGNSIDQAILLAKLLRDAGYDARIVGAGIDSDEAHAVLRAMKQAVVPAPAIGDGDKLLKVMARYNLVDSEISQDQRAAYDSFVLAPPRASATSIFDSVRETEMYISELLEEKNSLPSSMAVQTAMIEETKQYHWVQYKDSAADPWTDVHPVFAGEIPFNNPEATSFLTSEIPESLQHRLRFQVFIERKIGGRLEAVPVTSPWERPVANLIGTPLVFSNIADSMLSTESFGRSLESLLDQAQSFVPSFGSGMAQGARFFSLRGVLVDPMAATDAAAGLFATISGAFGDAVGRIGDESSIPTLTAQWLEFTLIAPDGTEEVFRRTTFDRVGAAARQQDEVPLDLEPTVARDVRPLMRRHTFMVSAGQIPRGYMIESALSRFERARPGLDAIMDKRYDRPAKPRSLSTVPVSWPGHLGLFSMFDIANTIGPNHRNYRSGPALVVHSDGLGDQSVRTETMDIVSNPRRVVDIRPDTPTIDPQYAIQSGIWETAIEGSMLSGGERLSTISVFSAAKSAGAESITLIPGESSRPSGISADTYAAISADISKGYAVIVPDHEMATRDSGWWRINLQTGETLGRIGDGRGGELVETLISMTISFAAFTYGAVGCMESSNEAAALCCHATNAGLALFTVGIGVGLEGTLGLAVGAVLDLNRAVAGHPIGAVCEAVTN